MLVPMKLLALLSVLFCSVLSSVKAMHKDGPIVFELEGPRNGTPFIQALKGETGTKPTAKAGAVQTAEGIFLRIDEGDYRHWVMKTTKGKEVSFFVLKPDASMEKVLAKPGKFAGKKCRVQWKSTTENIPGAGGKLKVKQILSVEWLGK